MINMMLNNFKAFIFNINPMKNGSHWLPLCFLPERQITCC
ncbi:hypothetical protein PMI17_03902 [Pantoea sp. GM01]|nr:hypothetical protein PMI17_03902 [Pantoea sp. GM01]